MRFVQKTYAEAAELNWCEPYSGLWKRVLAETGWTDYNDISGIWEVEDDIGYRFVGSDGGEPEDQTLGRNWRWVVDELNKAYLSGVFDAKEIILA